ncbi:MAG: hypothetical protein DCC71_09830 [Proteobacteria bacterium]|nr:MAG: hypothetical protein DCC71_09830 [Pseudomonadota bacterium]
MSPRTHGQIEWDRIRAQGMPRFVLIGALRRGIPMAIAVLVALELMESGTFGRHRLMTPEFLERVLLVFTVFVLGGALSSFARWKSHESLYGRDSST